MPERGGGNLKTNILRKTYAPAAGCMVLLACFASPATAQNVETILDGSYSAMYNLHFDEAFQKAEQAKAVDRSDPMPWVAQASAILFRELDRLQVLRSDLFASDAAFDARPAYNWVPSSKKQFDDALTEAESLSQARLGRNKEDLKGLFGMAMVDGLRANDSALITKHNISALSYIREGNGYANKLLALSPNYYDAYVGTGMGKYVIGGKAAPVRWILRLGGLKGDQEEGLKELSMAAEHGRFLAPFARVLLAFDDLRHKNKAAARKKFAALHELFPANPLFVQEMAKCDQASPGAGQ